MKISKKRTKLDNRGKSDVVYMLSLILLAMVLFFAKIFFTAFF